MQLYEASGNITVLMGGGRQHFYKNDHEDGRADDNDFIANWKADPNVKYIETRDELFAYENSGYGDMVRLLIKIYIFNF
jgi:alkaline phosphatase